jgi:hypothetical protein
MDSLDLGAGLSSPSESGAEDQEMGDSTRRDDGSPIEADDMEAYFEHCFDQRVQINSAAANQRLLDNLLRILEESEIKGKEEDFNTIGWFTESSKNSSTWPRDLWRMYRKNEQDSEEESRWEIALYRVTQLLSLILDIPSDKVNDLINGSIWDVIDFYGTLLQGETISP